jgi:hypothetical protein
MKNVYLTACFSLDFDLCLLDHFIKYYKSLGIKKENFLLVLNCFKGYENLNAGLEILERHNIFPGDVWCQEYESHEKWERVHRLISKYVNNESWVIHPDADEFFEFPHNLEKLLPALDAAGINAAQGFLVDRLSENGKIREVSSDDIFEQFPAMANLSNLIGIAGVKLMIYKGYLRANNGSGQIHDQCRNNVFYAHGNNESLHKTDLCVKMLGEWSAENSIPYEPKNFDESTYQHLQNKYGFLVHHFKWHGKVLEKLKQRLETYTKLGRPQVVQSLRLLQHYEKNQRFLF